MKKLQSNPAAKLCAVIVLLCAVFGAGVFGVRAVLSFGSVVDGSWQDSSRYYRALDSRQGELLNGIRLTQNLEQLEKWIEEGAVGELAYADAEALREERALVEERFSRQNTWFRFRLLTDNGKTLLGTNLKDDESMLKAVWNVSYFSFTLQGVNIYEDVLYYEIGRASCRERV